MYKKRLISIFMAMLMIVSSLGGFVASPQEVQAAETVDLGRVRVSKTGAGSNAFLFNGSPFLPATLAVVTYTKDVKTYPAYCIEPDESGATTDTGYDVTASSLYDNPKVVTAIMNGFPFVDNATLGVDNDTDAYAVTKLAIWSVIQPDKFGFNKTRYTARTTGSQKVVDALEKLSAKANAATAMPTMGQSLSMEMLSKDEVGEKSIQVFQVKSEGKNFTGDYTATLPSNVPTGTTLTQNGDQFTIVIPLSDVPANTSGSFEVKLSIAGGGVGAKGGAMIYVGNPDNANKQSYALAFEGEPTSGGSGKVNYSKDAPPPGGGGLRILKREAGTTTGLAGAKFRLTKLEDPKAGIVGDFETNTSGEINFPELTPGVYKIQEISPPKGYLIDIMNVKNVTITAAGQTTQDVTFENYKSPKLKLYKTDSFGIPIQGAMFKIALDGGTESYIGTTDAKGEILFGTGVELQSGTYTVSEVSVPAPYILDTTPKTVKLVAGKDTEIAFTNAKKSTWRLWKYIKGTTTLLDGAEFSIKNLDTNTVVWEGIVENGMHSLDGLDPGWYRISEIATAHGYVMEWVDEFGTVHKDAPYKDIKLEADKEVDIKFDNIQRPEIEILKVDNFGKPVAGAIFKFKKGDGTTQFQKTTDKDGRILIEYDDKDLILTEGVYEVTETRAPEGYIMAKECVQTVTLENGTRKTLTFVNTKKPTLTILKVDETTKQPLAGAKFKIVQTENKTIKEAITDKDGKIVLTDLDDVIYSIEEIVAPDGYLLEPQHKDVKLKPGESMELVFTNKAKPKLEILKIDSVTKQPIPNTKFKVEKVEDKTVSEYTTDAEGKILIENLDEAIYRVTETIAEDGYILNVTPKEIAAEWGKTKQLIFENVKKPTLIITKTNGLTYKPISNTTYKIEFEGANGGIVPLGTYRTDANGQIVIPKVNPGWYIVTELKAAPGFSLSSNPVTRKYLSPGENAYMGIGTGTEPETATVPTTQPTGGDTSGQNVKITYGNDYVVGEEILNYPLNSIILKKVNAITGELLEGAVFELRKVTEDVSGSSGTVIGRYTTNNSGIVVITGLEPGGYIAEEVQAPTNYLIAETSKQQLWLKPDGTSIAEITFNNYPYGNILITKVDAKTLKPLANARFRVTDGTGAVAGNTNGEFITNENGEALVSNLKPNAYVVTEVEAPENYAIDVTPQTVNVGTDGKTYKVNFKDQPFATLVIKKYNAETKEPLSDATFVVTTAKGDVVGPADGIFKTDETGTITIPNLPKGSYIAKETKSPTGFLLENQTQTIDVDYGKTYILDFYNKPMSSLIIKKFDKTTHAPLQGARFKITKKSGDVIGEYATDSNGIIQMDELPSGWYSAVEVTPPTGYKLVDVAQDFEITHTKMVTLEFPNEKLTSLIIKKVDDKSGAPLPSAVFTVEKQNGEHVGEFTTDTDGLINIPTLTPDWYVIREKKSPDGYLLDESPKTVQVKTDVPTIVTFTNKRLTSLQIKKIDEFTGVALPSAVFEIEKQNGEKIQTSENGTQWTTDAQGFINIPSLEPNYYTIREVKAPQGYVVNTTPQTVQVKTDAPTVVTFTNKPLSGLKILKLNSVTRAPIEGTEFVVSKMNGEKIENDLKGFTFKTDKTGQIFIPNLSDGYYIVTETKASDNYVLDSQPKTVLIESGKTTLLEVENTPASGLLIVKTDANTKKPLAGVKFEIKKANGERVQSSLLDKNQPNTENNSPNKTTTPNGDISGVYTTDANGRILINNIAVDEYNVIEKEALKGYELDTDVHSVTVTPGKQAVLELTNKPLAGLRILKIDAITKNPIFNTEFMVFDESGKVVGTYYSDNNGVVDLTGILTAGRYQIRETRAAENYYLDEVPKTINFEAGKTTEIVWTNIPKMGQVQISKTSADNNEINGLEAGTPLEGAVFEIYEYKSGNMVDRFVSASNGKAVSKPLPLGRYLIKEVQAPDYYKINKKELDVEIEFATQIVKLDFTNESANTGVYIKKVGNKEAMPGDTIRYDIKAVQNTGTVPLTDFFWRDTLPVDAVRLNKIITGTYNQSLKYKIMATTNKGNSMIISDNLSTTKNNAVDCSNASLGLKNDEYVTSFTLVFGNVKAGFAQVEQPQVYVNVLKTLPNAYQFANKADVGGKYLGEWIIGNSTILTTIYRGNSGSLPKTGY